MGQKNDLTDSEKSKIIKCLSEGTNPLKISKILGRDHRTIKHFIANSHRKKRVDLKRRKLTGIDLQRIKDEATRNPLSCSAAVFQNCSLPGVPRSTRCSVLRDVATARKAETAETRPPRNKTHKLKRRDRAKTPASRWVTGMGQLDVSGLKMDSKSTHKSTASF